MGEGLERLASLVDALQPDVARRDLTSLHRVLCRVESQLLGLSDATNNGEKTEYSAGVKPWLYVKKIF